MQLLQEILQDNMHAGRDAWYKHAGTTTLWPGLDDKALLITSPEGRRVAYALGLFDAHAGQESSRCVSGSSNVNVPDSEAFMQRLSLQMLTG